jgi:hypothetical protein
LSLWKYSPPKKHKKVVIVHSTNHRSHKGTRFILQTFAKLEKKLPIEIMMIENKTLAECQKLYPSADIVVPDIISGWHGFVTIEAMAIGRPVIINVRPDIMQFHAYYAFGRIPVISSSPDNLTQAITKLVRSSKLREDLGRKGREYVLKFHSLEFVGALRSIIYENIWQSKKIDQKIFEKEVARRNLIE